MRNSTIRRSSLYTVISSTAILAVPFVALAVDPLHPLGSTTIETVIGRLIGAVISLLGVLALVVFIWSGFSWMISAGSADKIKVAKKNMVYAVTGLIVCFSSYAILKFVLNVAIFGAASK